MKKILILGATGMAGHMIYNYLKKTEKYQLVNIVFRTPLNEESIVIDVNNREKLKSVVTREKADYIINCIGILIKGSNKRPDNAIYINAWLPHYLSKLADDLNAKLIHISTDCVFSGKEGNYTENDFRDADDLYGRSKALGEIICDRHLTIRTSIIGPELKNNGEGLFHWFMNQKGTVNGFTKMIWGGVTTLQLAKAIDDAIKQDISGLIHITNNQSISKYDLLKLIKRIWEKTELQIIPIEGKLSDKSLKSKRKDFKHNVPTYETMLTELNIWMKEIHETIYNY